MSMRCEQKNPSLGFTIRHHSESLVMPDGDPRDEFLTCLYEVKECLCYSPGVRVPVRVRVSARGLLGSVFAFRFISQQLEGLD